MANLGFYNDDADIYDEMNKVACQTALKGVVDPYDLVAQQHFQHVPAPAQPVATTVMNGWTGTDLEWMMDQICEIWSQIKERGIESMGDHHSFQNDLAAVYGTLLNATLNLDFTKKPAAKVVPAIKRVADKQQENLEPPAALQAPGAAAQAAPFIDLSQVAMDDFWALDHAKRLVYMKVCNNGDCSEPSCVRIHGDWDPKQHAEFQAAAYNQGDTLKGHLACRDQLLDSVGVKDENGGYRLLTSACARENCGYRHFVRLRNPLTCSQITALLYSYWTRVGRSRPPVARVNHATLSTPPNLGPADSFQPRIRVMPNPPVMPNLPPNTRQRLITTSTNQKSSTIIAAKW